MAVTYNQFINIVGNDVAEKYTQAEINRILVEARQIVIDWIIRNSYRTYVELEATVYELAQIDLATIEQAKYIIANGGNIGNMSGFDPVNNTFISQDEIDKRIISPRAKDKLVRMKYFYRGIR